MVRKVITDDDLLTPGTHNNESFSLSCLHIWILLSPSIIRLFELIDIGSVNVRFRSKPKIVKR
jgi:hypothetical protein